MTSGNLHVVFMFGPVTVADIEADTKSALAILTTHPSLFRLIVIDSGKAGSPTPEVREAVTRSSKQIGDRVGLTAIAVVGDKLQAMVMRTAIGGINMVTGQGTRTKTVGDLEAAVKLLKAAPGLNPSAPGDLDAALIARELGLSAKLAA